jgi:hypothetical protein
MVEAAEETVQRAVWTAWALAKEGVLHQVATCLLVCRILAERLGVGVHTLVPLEARAIHHLPTRLEVVREEGSGQAWQVCNV